MTEISFDEFKKIELKVGKIKEVEKIAGADKLLKLKVDIGKEIQIVAGIAKHYTAKELKNKRVVVVANLKPVKLKGVESNGMLLAAVDDAENKVVLLTTGKEIKEGANVQ